MNSKEISKHIRKIALIGDKETGKTSFLVRLLHNKCYDSKKPQSIIFESNFSFHLKKKIKKKICFFNTIFCYTIF